MLAPSARICACTAVARALADRERRDHRGDADDDAEHGQARAHAVARQRLRAQLEQLRRAPSSAGRRPGPRNCGPPMPGGGASCCPRRTSPGRARRMTRSPTLSSSECISVELPSVMPVSTVHRRRLAVAQDADHAGLERAHRRRPPRPCRGLPPRRRHAGPRPARRCRRRSASAPGAWASPTVFSAAPTSARVRPAPAAPAGAPPPPAPPTPPPFGHPHRRPPRPAAGTAARRSRP